MQSVIIITKWLVFIGVFLFLEKSDCFSFLLLFSFFFFFINFFEGIFKLNVRLNGNKFVFFWIMTRWWCRILVPLLLVIGGVIVDGVGAEPGKKIIIFFSGDPRHWWCLSHIN